MDMNFQKGVIVFFGILLVGILIFLGVSLNKNKKTRWPPITSPCPDYWLDGPNPNQVAGTPYVSGSYCKPTYVSGTTGPYLNNPNNIQSMNFTTPSYMGSSGTCNMYNWSTGVSATAGSTVDLDGNPLGGGSAGNVSWDGITYGVSNPCNSSSTTTVNSTNQ